MTDICPTMREWTIKSVSYDGEPAKAAVAPEFCCRCMDLEKCVAKVRFASWMDQMMEAVIQL